MMFEMTNAKRAQRAIEQIRGYSGENDDSTDVKDIVTDILHWLRREHDMDSEQRMAWLMDRVEMNDEEIAEDTEE